jgi:hypothetical protein
VAYEGGRSITGPLRGGFGRRAALVALVILVSKFALAGTAIDTEDALPSPTAIGLLVQRCDKSMATKMPRHKEQKDNSL